MAFPKIRWRRLSIFSFSPFWSCEIFNFLQWSHRVWRECQSVICITLINIPKTLLSYYSIIFLMFCYLIFSASLFIILSHVMIACLSYTFLSKSVGLYGQNFSEFTMFVYCISLSITCSLFSSVIRQTQDSFPKEERCLPLLMDIVWL